MNGFAAGAAVRPVPVAGAAFAAATTIISGLRSPATDALLELRHDEVPRGSVQWTESGVQDASEALATGLCHAVALEQDHGAGGGAADAIAALVARVGEVTVIEIARTASTSEVLIVPDPAFDSPPIAALRAVLRSTAFQRRLLRYGGYSGRETWHGATQDKRSIDVLHGGSIDDVRNLALATRGLSSLDVPTAADPELVCKSARKSRPTPPRYRPTCARRCTT